MTPSFARPDYAKLKGLSRLSHNGRRRESSEGLNDLLHIRWNKPSIFLKLTGGRMMEAQRPRMQHHTGNLDILNPADLFPAVGLIS